MFTQDKAQIIKKFWISPVLKRRCFVTRAKEQVQTLRCSTT